MDLILLFSGVVAGATPVVLATLGETISEKAGVINLSLDGTILLSAMAAFVISYETNSLALGFFTGAIIGGLVAAVVVFFSLHLNQSQVAVGFVLTLMTRDLAYYLGSSYSRLPGPQVHPYPVPLLNQLPIIGPIFFDHNIIIYFSLFLIFICWLYIYKTPFGLNLRAVGEHPKAAYARGINPRRLQMVYAVCGGLLIGLAGAVFSLSTKPGWGKPQGAEGIGWIALALVIFGGWHPLRAAVGAYFFSFLQVMGINFQEWFPSVPAQVFNVAPFPLMILTLLFLNVADRNKKHIRHLTGEKKGRKRSMRSIFSGSAPLALGKPYQPDLLD